MVLGYEYSIILSPINTEKTTKQQETDNKYCFLVDKSASKCAIKKAIKFLFDIDVESINIVNTNGKTKRFKGRVGKRPDRKKAIISVKNGEKIDVTKLR